MKSLQTLCDKLAQQVLPETSLVLRENGMKLQMKENADNLKWEEMFSQKLCTCFLAPADTLKKQ